MKSQVSKKSSVPFLGTAAALAAVSTSASQGALVQITLSNNQLSLGFNTLNADLTGDNTDDITISGIGSVINPPMMGTLIFSTTSFTTFTPSGGTFTFQSIFSTFILGNPGTYGVQANFNGAGANATQLFSTYGALFGSNINAPGGGPVGGIPVVFSDPSIFGGSPTNAFLEIEANGLPLMISLTRLVFDDGTGAGATPNAGVVLGQSFAEFSPVPEPSGLALLALGAGGITLRRKRRAS